ncbi:hypothetical protein GCM10020000_24990 [Streptomyces olivoverticillatus]
MQHDVGDGVTDADASVVNERPALGTHEHGGDELPRDAGRFDGRGREQLVKLGGLAGGGEVGG